MISAPQSVTETLATTNVAPATPSPEVQTPVSFNEFLQTGVPPTPSVIQINQRTGGQGRAEPLGGMPMPPPPPKALDRKKELDVIVESPSFLDGPDAVPSSIPMPEAKFNPFKPLPKTKEEVYKEHALHRLAVLEMPNYLDAPEEEFNAFAKQFDDVSLNVIEEMISNRETTPQLAYAMRDDGTQSNQLIIEYVKPTGQVMKTLPLSEEDITMIGAATGMKSQKIYEYQLGEMQKNIMAKRNDIALFEKEMQELDMADTPAFQQVFQSQTDLLNEMLDRYDGVYAEYEKYLTDRGLTNE